MTRLPPPPPQPALTRPGLLAEHATARRQVTGSDNPPQARSGRGRTVLFAPSDPAAVTAPDVVPAEPAQRRFGAEAARYARDLEALAIVSSPTGEGSMALTL